MNRAHDTLQIGVVLERRYVGDRWQSRSWRPWALMPPGSGRRWRLLRDAGSSALFHSGNHVIQLHRDETGAYKQNLTLDIPLVYVALRPAPEAPVEDALEPFRAMVSFDEAQAYAEGDDPVHPVAMPLFVAEWVARFVDAHHVDRPFVRHARKGGSAGVHGGAGIAEGRRVARHGWEVPSGDG